MPKLPSESQIITPKWLGNHVSWVGNHVRLHTNQSLTQISEISPASWPQLMALWLCGSQKPRSWEVHVFVVDCDHVDLALSSFSFAKTSWQLEQPKLMTNVLLCGSWPIHIIKQPQEKFAILSKLYPITLCRRLTVNGTHSNIYGLHTGSRFPQKMDPCSPCSRVSESFDSMCWTCLVSMYRVSVWDDHGTQVCVPLPFLAWSLLRKSLDRNIFGYTSFSLSTELKPNFSKRLVKKRKNETNPLWPFCGPPLEGIDALLQLDIQRGRGTGTTPRHRCWRTGWCRTWCPCRYRHGELKSEFPGLGSSFRLWFWNCKLIFFSTVKVTAVTVNHSIGKATPGCLGGLRVEKNSNGIAMLRHNIEVFGVYQAKASHQI